MSLACGMNATGIHLDVNEKKPAWRGILAGEGGTARAPLLW